MGIFVLWATWAHEYIAIFLTIHGHRTSGPIIKLCDLFSANNTGKALFRIGFQTNNNDLTRRNVRQQISVLRGPII